MRVLVCGGRDFDNAAYVFTKLDRLHAQSPITALIRGDATGADALGGEWAAMRGVERWICRADWQRYGKAAGPKRNARMLEWEPDLVVAFPGGRGTADMVRRAKASGIEIMEV